MKNIIAPFLLYLIISSSTCRKEGNNCHYSVVINNNSPNPIVYAIPIMGFGQAVPTPNSEIKCRLDGEEIEIGGSRSYRPYNWCIERSLGGSEKITIILVDPSSFNDVNIMYDCDSIADYNLILAYHKLTIEDLKAMDFTINYP